MIINGIINAIWHWVFSWAWYWQLVAAACVVLIIWGGVANFYRTLKMIGGWQAAAGGVGLLVVVLGVIFGPRAVQKHVAGKADPIEYFPDGHPDTVPKKKRYFNPDTGRWE